MYHHMEEGMNVSATEQEKLKRGRIEAGILIGAIIGIAIFGLIIGTLLDQVVLWLIITGVAGAAVGLLIALNLNKKDKRVE